MDLKQLKYFLTVAEEGQITSAAKRLNMAQPPLSQQLKSLEAELGVKLFERGSRHIHLTDAGNLLVMRARQILELSDSTVQEINEFGKRLRGTLSIGMVSTSGVVFFNEGALQFHKDNPLIRFEISEGNTYEVLELLSKGIIEIGIVRTPFKTEGLNIFYLKKEPMIAVMTKEYMESFKAPSISIDDLKDKPLIAYRRFSKLIYETFLNSGIQPFIICKNDDARTTLQWAKSGLGIGIVPKSAFKLVGNDNIFYKEIDCEGLVTQIALIWDKNKKLSLLAEKFIESFSSNN